MTAQAQVPGSAPDATEPAVVPDRRTRRWARIAAMSGYVVAVAVWWWRIGIPNDSITVILTLWVGTIAWNIEAPWRRHLQFVRDWATQSGWDKEPPAPAIPDEVVEGTRQRYAEAYEKITGEPFTAWLERTGAPAA